MKNFKWLEYPENQPDQSGMYVVNRDINNLVSNTLAYFDIGVNKWYVDPTEMVPLNGVNAFNSKRILPFVKVPKEE
jgi:hypothetical protein